MPTDRVVETGAHRTRTWASKAQPRDPLHGCQTATVDCCSQGNGQSDTLAQRPGEGHRAKPLHR